ncbi:hypothetical protein CVT24_011937 [Panaeolus cyanescens]|uniref:Uncharacterized protein n=1 Tax=Panaeolus cyanescens TaxID=181874 RepID=A0A409W5U2_9AGAR|nr:hypothetical protein CVT24_011937 [Panaeolus cyanescens]
MSQSTDNSVSQQSHAAAPAPVADQAPTNSATPAPPTNLNPPLASRPVPPGLKLTEGRTTGSSGNGNTTFTVSISYTTPFSRPLSRRMCCTSANPDPDLNANPTTNSTTIPNTNPPTNPTTNTNTNTNPDPDTNPNLTPAQSLVLSNLRTQFISQSQSHAIISRPRADSGVKDNDVSQSIAQLRTLQLEVADAHARGADTLQELEEQMRLGVEIEKRIEELVKREEEARRDRCVCEGELMGNIPRDEIFVTGIGEGGLAQVLKGMMVTNSESTANIQADELESFESVMGRLEAKAEAKAEADKPANEIDAQAVQVTPAAVVGYGSPQVEVNQIYWDKPDGNIDINNASSAEFAREDRVQHIAKECTPAVYAYACVQSAETSASVLQLEERSRLQLANRIDTGHVGSLVTIEDGGEIE